MIHFLLNYRHTSHGVLAQHFTQERADSPQCLQNEYGWQRGSNLKMGASSKSRHNPQNVGYKNHTDCIVGYRDKRDRLQPILVYLRDVDEGGETKFPQLGISVKPRKGLALIWNSNELSWRM
ncbi:hypothetical protein OS493_039905 [Desmophyllum pertusum]|uniref:Prolyl 4-hydroxylase alpha subunit Fe(2+) 2OG dioxygenase domain-containing protein n=1 Tax=Desmophyllum pertusum TaxID=174260 RepID=A0A9W9YTR6_9CNID|nr:hypothetical protein OS493_039905 [Desmophyllum pertusum]